MILLKYTNKFMFGLFVTIASFNSVEADSSLFTRDEFCTLEHIDSKTINALRILPAEKLISWCEKYIKQPAACSLLYLVSEKQFPADIVIKQFSSYGHDFWTTSTTVNRYTPLMLAASMDDYSLVKCILAHISLADIFAQNAYGETVKNYSRLDKNIKHTPASYYTTHIIHERIHQLRRKAYAAALAQTAYDQGILAIKSNSDFLDTQDIFLDNSYVASLPSGTFDAQRLSEAIYDNDELLELLRKATNNKIYPTHVFIPASSFDNACGLEYITESFDLELYDATRPTTNSTLLDAACWGDTELINKLLAAGYDVNYKAEYPESNDFGSTALEFALQTGQVNAVKALLDAPDICLNGNAHWYALLDYKYSQEIFEEMLSLLLNQPSIDINRPGEEGITPLMSTFLNAKNNFSSIAGKKLLEDQRIDISAKNDSGQTALHIALDRFGFNHYDTDIQYVENIERLIDIADDNLIKIKDNNGKTALELAPEYINDYAIKNWDKVTKQ